MKQKSVLTLDLTQFSQSLIEGIEDSSHLPSIAVLRFVEQDEESRGQHSGSWLSDDIIHHLSRFRVLSVLGRQASEAVSRKHGSLASIGRSLGTRYLATGSVRWTADHLVVAASLVESASGQELWRSSFQMAADGSDDPEEMLAIEVATGLAVAIDAKERQDLEQSGDDRSEASQTAPMTLMADHLSKQFRPAANRRARDLATKACRLDPSSARAHAVLSRTHHLDCRYAWTSNPDKSTDKALELAEYAIELDPMEAAGYAELGMNRLFLKDYGSAQAAYQRALEINPNDPDILAEFGGLLIGNGSPEEAIEPLGLAIHLRPERAGMYRYYLAGAFDAMGDDETAVSLFSTMSDDHEAHRLLAACYTRLGQKEKADRHVDLAMKAHPDFSLARWRTILPYRDTDALDHLIEGLERAGFS